MGSESRIFLTSAALQAIAAPCRWAADQRPSRQARALGQAQGRSTGEWFALEDDVPPAFLPLEIQEMERGAK
jgi:hypothetical protein